MSESRPLSGRTAVVTGASSGIGQAIAGELGVVGMAGAQVEVKRGERLPDEIFENLQPKLKQLLGHPRDIARAVLYAVTQPIEVNVAEIVVRPAKQMNF